MEEVSPFRVISLQETAVQGVSNGRAFGKEPLPFLRAARAIDPVLQSCCSSTNTMPVRPSHQLSVVPPAGAKTYTVPHPSKAELSI